MIHRDALDEEELRESGGSRPAREIAAEILAIAGDEYRVIGLVSKPAAQIWEARTRITRLTAERRDHYLAKRPELANYHADIIETVRDPDEIHSYPGNPRSANHWRQVDPTHDIQVAVFMSQDAELANWVIRAVYSRAREIRSRRNEGRMLWSKADRGNEGD